MDSLHNIIFMIPIEVIIIERLRRLSARRAMVNRPLILSAFRGQIDYAVNWTSPLSMDTT